MPNSNPSGTSQPMRRHPKPGANYYTLGKDGQILSNLVAGQDYSLIAAPPSGCIREVPAAVVGGIQLVLAGATADAIVEMVYKDGSGREIVVATTTLSFANDVDSPLFGGTPAAGMFLTPDDDGLYLRFTGGTGGIVSAQVAWSDIRGVSRKDTVLTQTPQAVHDLADPGETVFIPSMFFSVSTLWAFNYSPGDAHTVVFEITDGNTTINNPIAIPVAAASAVPIPYLYNALPPGFEFRASLGEAPSVDGDLVFMMSQGITNQGPVKEYQGGAY